MKLSLLLLLAATVLTSANVQAQRSNAKHTEWIGKVLTEVETVKVGMTRGQMRKVFREQGGISTVTWQTYVYRDCPYIKVDFQFEPHGREIRDAEGRLQNSESDQDKITSMSKPYLAFATVD